MSNTEDVKAQIEMLRQQTIGILRDLAQKTLTFDLPALPTDLERYSQKLAMNTYNVLVVGEAKRGKSSFVNALIGRELLPTDVDAATSQVFRVRNVQQEAYSLCFEDGSTQAISKEELTEYGSQSAVDRKGISRFDLDQLRWIEVDVPIRYLPEGVALLDTPGLGSVYAGHTIITQRLVPQADAVIYVLDSRQPIGELDLQFLQEIYNVTRYIFFIQTKIDLYDPQEWQQQQQRHVAILQQHFKDLPDTRVWPISNRNLLKFEATRNPAFLKVSRQQDLVDALEKFLFRVSGGSRCIDALVVADHFYRSSRSVLAERLSAVETNSTQELTLRQQTAAQQRKQLESEWGASGKERNGLHDRAQQIVTSGKQVIIDLLEPGGTLETTQRRKIDSVKSLKEVNDLGKTMYDEIVTQVNSVWRSSYNETREQCAILLKSLEDSTNEITVSQNDPNLPLHPGSSVHERENLLAKLFEAQGDFVGGVNLGLAAAPLAIIFFHVAVPVALVGIAIAGVMAAAQGWGFVKDAEVREGQDKLYEYFSHILLEIRRQFLQPSIHYGGASLVNHDFDAILEKIDDRLDETVKKKIEKAQQESQILEEQIGMNKQQRAVQAEKLRQQLAEWDALGPSIYAVAEELQKVGRSLTQEANVDVSGV